MASVTSRRTFEYEVIGRRRETLMLIILFRLKSSQFLTCVMETASMSRCGAAISNHWFSFQLLGAKLGQKSMPRVE